MRDMFIQDRLFQSFCPPHVEDVRHTRSRVVANAALPHITRLKVVAEDETMPLDAGTRRNLELTEGLRSRSAYGSLLWMLDRTVTAMGGRMLRAWVEQPLLSPLMIEERLDAVEALHTSPVLQEELLQGLRQVYDMERLLSKVSYRTLNARDCLSLLRSLNQAPLIRAQLHSATAQGLRNIWTLLDEVPDITQLLESAIHSDAPLVITEGGIIRDGYSQELDSGEPGFVHVDFFNGGRPPGWWCCTTMCRALSPR